MLSEKLKATEKDATNDLGTEKQNLKIKRKLVKVIGRRPSEFLGHVTRRQEVGETAKRRENPREKNVREESQEKNISMGDQVVWKKE